VLPFLLTATEFAPWYDNDLEIQSRSKILYQTFNKLGTHDGKTCYLSNDVFLNQSLGISFDKYAAEVELCAAATRKQHFNLDHLKLTGRYRLLDDITDDPYSVVAGVSFIQAGQPALYDPASFHHGIFGVETHISVGKEVSTGQFWQKRYFGVLAFGLSYGSPWVRGNFTYLQNVCNLHTFGAFINTLVGFGGQNLKVGSFHGYGTVRHQSVDLGISYSYLIEKIDGELTGDYSYRVYAKNFPKNASRLAVTLWIPFGLGI
jgi:hypothetical protein